MKESLVCNLCSEPGTFENAADKRLVPCHLRSHREQNFYVWRCKNCLSLHSKEFVDLDYFYSIYPFRKQRLDWATRAVYGNRLKLLQNHGLKKHHSILDFGSGQGLFEKFLQARGYGNIVSFDPYLIKNAETEPIDRQYDFVMAQDVLEHVDEPEETISLLEKCLKSGGTMVIGCPNATGIDLSKSAKYANELHQPYHRHIPSKTALEGLLRRYGFSKIECHLRYYFDTVIPGVNTLFVNEYTLACGAFAEALVEPPNFRVFLSNPLLFYHALTGYFSPGQANMILFCTK